MNYNLLLDLVSDLGYELAMSGAETSRVEETITRVLSTYGVGSEVFAIPNYFLITIQTEDGTPITRMRRIGYHGNDLYGVELFSDLSRKLCQHHPQLHDAMLWLEDTKNKKAVFTFPVLLLGYFLGAFGFGIFLGGSFPDGICAGLCGIVAGTVSTIAVRQNANPFFHTIAASFFMALLAYGFGAAGIAPNADAVTIGALMILVPGLLFTNAMRDIIYGDINSGVNRIVQVFLVAAALAVGTAAALGLSHRLFGVIPEADTIDYPLLISSVFCFIGCVGFSILFNIHKLGILLCVLGGTIAWISYCITLELMQDGISAYFVSAFVASLYSEILARIRKFPALSYLVISIFPMIPGAGVYYTMIWAVRGNMEQFFNQGMYTAAIAGVMAVGILLPSTLFRMYADWRRSK